MTQLHSVQMCRSEVMFDDCLLHEQASDHTEFVSHLLKLEGRVRNH